MLVSLTVGKIDAGITVLLTQDKRLIEFPSILLPPNISPGSIVDIAVSRNLDSEASGGRDFAALQDRILAAFGASEPTTPVLRCRNATQTSVVLEWDPIQIATADLLSLSLYRNNQKAGTIPRPLSTHSTKISGLAVDTEYSFHLLLRTTAGSHISKEVTVRTHQMENLTGVTITPGIMSPAAREALEQAVHRIGARIADEVRIDTTHFVTNEGRGLSWERAVEMNIPVVRPEWVDACERGGRILGVTRFYLDAVRQPGGSPLEESAAAAAAAATTSSRQKSLPDLPSRDRPSPKAPRQGEGKKGSGKKEAGKKKEPEKDESEERESDREKGSPAASATATMASPVDVGDEPPRGSVEQKVLAREQDMLGPGEAPYPDLVEDGGQKSGQSDDKPSEEDKDDHKEGADENEETEDLRARGLASPDGASFQDVAL